MPTPQDDKTKNLYMELVARKGATLDTMSLMNLPLQHLCEKLKNQLKSVFKKDPAPGFVLEVDEKYKDYWEKTTADLSDNKDVKK